MATKKTSSKKQKLKDINTKPFFAVLLMLMAITLLTDAIYRFNDEALEASKIGFYAWFSIISCFLLVGAAQFLQKLIKRQEKYYRREAELS